MTDELKTLKLIEELSGRAVSNLDLITLKLLVISVHAMAKGAIRRNEQSMELIDSSRVVVKFPGVECPSDVEPVQ